MFSVFSWTMEEKLKRAGDNSKNGADEHFLYQTKFKANARYAVYVESIIYDARFTQIISTIEFFTTFVTGKGFCCATYCGFAKIDFLRYH